MVKLLTMKKYYIKTFGCPTYAQVRFEVYIHASETSFRRGELVLKF